VSTLREIKAAILELSPAERWQLIADLPALLPELNGDAAWERILHDPRPGLWTGATITNVYVSRQLPVSIRAPVFRPGPGVWTFLTPCLSANGAAYTSLGQRPRSGPEQCQRAESPPHAHRQASIPVHDESRFQRSERSLADEPRALPWAGMNDAVGVSNRPAVPPGCCLSGNLVVRPEGELI